MENDMKTEEEARMNDRETNRQAQAKHLIDRELENVTGGQDEGKHPPVSFNNDYRYCPECGSIVPVHSAKTGGWVCDPKGHRIS